MPPYVWLIVFHPILVTLLALIALVLLLRWQALPRAPGLALRFCELQKKNGDLQGASYAMQPLARLSLQRSLPQQREWIASSLRSSQ
ncbi:hypothetical protein [Bradyrhizobium sp. URHD0069]|uniref:hypothetical protein n=1 Tax=Bradyrhizobium sp. URHD0069 TaxID=1380355 RepID=UPI000495956E|nr:hypothetical protein [Bradyrhizobium sp. URHD0069]